MTEAQKRRVAARAGLVLRAVAQDECSQLRNRELAVERLVAQLRGGPTGPRRRLPTAPSAAARERRLEEKRQRGELKRLRQRPVASSSEPTPTLAGVDRDAVRRAAAEFVGTFALVFVGAGSVMLAGGGGLVGIALAHGLVIGVMVSAVGHISGGHFNPAVTLGFLVTRRMEPVLAVVYWVTQLGAAVLASLLLWWVIPGELADPAHLGAPQLLQGGEQFSDVSVWAGVVVEAILTFFLVWVVFATAADPRGTFKSIAGLAIGFTITFDILIGGSRPAPP